MLRRTVTFPQVAAIAVTRALLGAGIGLLVADQMDSSRRKRIGWSLLALGALSTIPLLVQFFCDKPCRSHAAIEEENR